MTLTVTWVAAWITFSITVIIAAWRVDQLLANYVRAHTPSADERDVAITERRNAAELTRLTLAETAELRRAELLVKIAEARDVEAGVSALAADRLAGQREILTAWVAAERELAVETVRKNHDARLRTEDVLDKYERYMQTTHNRGASYMTFDDFTNTLSDYEV